MAEMPRQAGYSELLRIAVQSASAGLAVLAGGMTRDVRAVTAALERGDADAVRRCFDASSHPGGAERSSSERLGRALSDLARALPAAAGDQVEGAALSTLAACLRRLAEELASLGATDQAYNLYEISYHVQVVLGEPALPTTRGMHRCCNPGNYEQLAACLWALATEQLRASVDHGGDWLAAIDAVEMALSAAPESPGLQRQVYSRLLAVLRRARDTPVAELVAIVSLQAPPASMPRERRERFIRTFLETRFPRLLDAHPGATTDAMEWLAVTAAQTMIDDLRLGFMKPSEERASLTWLERVLRHPRLTSAVPLGKALVADVDRTGLLAMELAHEIGHAFALLGPIGWACSGLRVSIHGLEAMLIAAAGPAQEGSQRPALAHLPDAPGVLDIAERQLACGYRAAVLRAVWTPWLEGISVYLELLCDVADDPTEINAVHEALRSLIDVVGDAPRHDSADSLTEAYAQSFERFYSQAFRRNARLRHHAYLGDENAAVYLTGYVLVRAVVARWELTLNRRIVPAIAVKLLLAATRNGATVAAQGLTDPPARFHAGCQDRFLRWCATIAALDRTSLQDFFAAVQPHERSLKHGWRGGRPVRLTQADAASDTEDAYRAAQQAAIELTGLPHLQAHPSAMPGENLADTVARLFQQDCLLAALLPVGRDFARALLFGSSGRIAMCPRSYAGERGATGDRSAPRYSIGSWMLNAPADARQLRQLLARQASSRLLTTRIIDLGGVAPATNGRANHSFVCFHLPGTKWIHLSLVYPGPNIAEAQPAFRDLVMRRLNPPADLHDEAATTGSLGFMVRRLLAAGKPSPVAALARAFDERAAAEQMGFAAVAAACGRSVDEIERATRQVLASELACTNVADYLFHSGMGRDGLQVPVGSAAQFSQSMFDARAASGVRCHSGER